MNCFYTNVSPAPKAWLTTSSSASLPYKKFHFLSLPAMSPSQQLLFNPSTTSNLILIPPEHYSGFFPCNAILSKPCRICAPIPCISLAWSRDQLSFCHRWVPIVVPSSLFSLPWAWIWEFCNRNEGKQKKKIVFPFVRSHSLPAFARICWDSASEFFLGKAGGKNLFPTSRFSPALTCLSMKKKKSPLL